MLFGATAPQCQYLGLTPTLLPLPQLLGDSFYSMCHVEAVEHHARDAAFGFRAFAYELQHRGEHAFSDLFRGPSPAWNLACEEPFLGDKRFSRICCE